MSDFDPGTRVVAVVGIVALGLLLLYIVLRLLGESGWADWVGAVGGLLFWVWVIAYVVDSCSRCFDNKFTAVSWLWSGHRFQVARQHCVRDVA